MRTDRLISLGLFLFVFAVYAATCCRTIYTGDSGDFLTAIATGGIPHPSGYPFFLLVGKAFSTLVPIGEFAFRINLLVSLCGAIAAAFVYRFLALLLADRAIRHGAAIFGALIFAFAPTVWEQSLISEVYSLNLMFLAIVLYLSLRWVRTPQENTREANNRLALLTFTYGLALTNHMSMALVFPVFLILVLWRKPTLIGKDALLILPLACLFLLPLSLYTYLPLAAKLGQAPIYWGSPTTWETFFFHISGRRYSDMMFPGIEIFRFGLWEYLFRLLPEQFGYLLVLAPVGLVGLLRSKNTRPHGYLLLAVYLISTLYAVNYATPDIAAYHLPSYLIMACWIGAGAAVIGEEVLVRLAKGTEKNVRLLYLATGILCAVPIIPMTMHWAVADKSSDYRERDYGMNLLRSLPPNAMLFMDQDTIFTIWYEQFVLKQRPDVAVIQINLFRSNDISSWYGDTLRRAYPWLADSLPPKGSGPGGEAGLIRLAQSQLNAGRPLLFLPAIRSIKPKAGERREVVLRLRTKQQAPVVSTNNNTANGKPSQAFGEWASANYYLFNYGLAVRLYPRTAPPPTALERTQENIKVWNSFTLRGVFDNDWNTDDDPLHYWMAARYCEAIYDFGRTAEEARQYDLALTAYKQSAGVVPDFAEAVNGIQRLESAGVNSSATGTTKQP